MSDKAFVAACTQRLISYLASHGYDHPVSPKLLSSNKEFANVVAFLAKRCDPGAPPLTGRVEDEVPQLFKRLRYPFAIPKSALQAVGSPHTWPSLLAAVAWLVELLLYDEAASKHSGAARVTPAGSCADAPPFFDFCSASYAAFMSGDDTTADALDDQLEQQQRSRDTATSAACDRLTAACAALDDRLDAARSAQGTLPGLRRTQDAMNARIAALQADIDGRREHLEHLVHKAEERHKEAAAREEELRQQKAHTAALAARVASQGLSATDIARLTAERTATEGVLASVQAQAQVAEERAREAGSAADRCADDVDAASCEYHAACVALKALPASAKRARGGVFEVQCAFHSSTTSDVDALAERLRTVVRPALEQIRDEYRTRYREAGAARLRLDEDLDASEAALADKREHRRALEAEVARAEGALAECRTRIQAAVAAAEQAAAALEADTVAQQQAQDAQLERSDAGLAAARTAYDDLSAQCASEVAHTHHTLLAVMDLAMMHKQAVQDALTKCHGVLHVLLDGLTGGTPEDVTHMGLATVARMTATNA